VNLSVKSDRAQRDMLRAAVNATNSERSKRLPKAPANLKWLLDRADALAEDRNNAVHAPCSLYLGGSVSEMGAAFFNGNPRAKNLMGKELLPNCGTDFPFRAADDNKEHPKFFVQIVPRVSDLADRSGIGLEGFFRIFKTWPPYDVRFGRRWRAHLRFSHNKRTQSHPTLLRASFGPFNAGFARSLTGSAKKLDGDTV
jgi:hypothetical protein